ncbi:MAG: hypothetical protein EAZ60_23835 [Oscillatoriales cyanobacterium]|nr:MAG: hypothetical protein EAZ60_23835 [Oscillatoriales cyanobacterium]
MRYSASPHPACLGLSSDSKVAARKAPASPTVRPEPVPVPKMPPRVDRPSPTEQIMLAVTEEITNLRSGLTGPLQEEIAALRQEQQALTLEIKQLEAKRQQQQSLAQQQANQQQIISDFLQVLTGRLEETLDRDLSQIFSSLENQLLPSSAAQSQQSALSPQTSEEHPLLTPAQRLEQMQRFQASADSLLMRLDSTMGIVFEALEFEPAERGNVRDFCQPLGGTVGTRCLFLRAAADRPAKCRNGFPNRRRPLCCHWGLLKYSDPPTSRYRK